MLAGRDLMAGAQTGTGKTAAFALPILQMLAPARQHLRLARAPSGARAGAHAHARARGAGRRKLPRLRQAPAAAQHGGLRRRRHERADRAAAQRASRSWWRRPGRLLDHVQNKTVMFNQVSILVLDEADRMLDMGFLPDIKRIIALLPAQRQNLLFSATFPDEIRNLAKALLTQSGRDRRSRRATRSPTWSRTSCTRWRARKSASCSPT